MPQPPKNKIVRGDCLDVMRQWPDSSIPLIVTSPPFNLRNTAGKGPPTGRWNGAIMWSGYQDFEDNMPRDDYVLWQRQVLSQCMRLIPEDGAIFYNHHWRSQNKLIEDQREIIKGFPVRQIIIWHRPGGINWHRSFFLPVYQVIYLIAKHDFMLRKGAQRATNVWRMPPEHNNPHPAPFPVELPRRAIAATDAPLVLDPFMGSGTTAIAALTEGRNYLGIEQSRLYCKQARERICSWKREHKKYGNEHLDMAQKNGCKSHAESSS